MRYSLKCVFCILASIPPLTAQQVGYVDLASPPPDVKKRSEKPLPPGCKNFGGGFADGFPQPEDGKKREIVVEFTKVEDTTLSAGSDFIAEVRLTNASSKVIKIPWSTDEAIIDASPDPDYADFEMGDFDVSLIDGSGSVVALKSLSGSLFGSKYATGSERKIGPGEWITARIKVTVDAENHFDLDALTEGKAQLTVKWQQRGRTWSLNREKCEVWRGSFPYDYFYYNQLSKPAAVTITKRKAADSGNKDTALK